MYVQATNIQVSVWLILSAFPFCVFEVFAFQFELDKFFGYKISFTNFADLKFM